MAIPSSVFSADNQSSISFRLRSNVGQKRMQAVIPVGIAYTQLLEDVRAMFRHEFNNATPAVPASTPPADELRATFARLPAVRGQRPEVLPRSRAVGAVAHPRRPIEGCHQHQDTRSALVFW